MKRHLKSLYAALTLVVLTVGCAADDTPGGLKPVGSPPPAGSGGAGGDMGGGAGGAGGDDGGATGPEDCLNGLDDNGDGLVDCRDGDPLCEAVCADACSAPIDLEAETTIAGDTTGHPSVSKSSCGLGAGAAHVFRLASHVDGMLDAYLSTADDGNNFTLSIRTACADVATEVACSESVTGHEAPGQEHAVAAVSSGAIVFIVVQGVTAEDVGAYALSVSTRVPACGDAHVDAGEECDDGNTWSGDACDENCRFMPTEVENNGTFNDANTYDTPWYAEIGPAGDMDMVRVEATSAQYGFAIDVFDLGDGACAKGELNSYVALVDEHFNEVAFDDSSGDGFCSRMVARKLQPGDYFLLVAASPTGAPGHVFKYHLDVTGDKCGNGMVGGPETCDDGNAADGDGCSRWCTIE